MIEDTLAHLDQLLQADAARKERPLALLRSVVQGLDGSSSPPVDEPDPEGDVRPNRRSVTAPADPYVPLPRRKTPGGRFGPAVVAKLRAEALGR